MTVNNFTIVDINHDITEEQKQQVLALWVEHNALPAGVDPEKRVQQVAQMVYEPEGKLIGIYTCYRQLNPQIKKHFFYIRAFVSPEYRMSHASEDMFNRLVARKEKDFVDGRQAECIGMVAELENHGMQKQFNQAIWAVVPFVYIGDNELGSKVYVYYFAGATI